MARERAGMDAVGAVGAARPGAGLQAAEMCCRGRSHRLTPGLYPWRYRLQIARIVTQVTPARGSTHLECPLRAAQAVDLDIQQRAAKTGEDQRWPTS